VLVVRELRLLILLLVLGFGIYGSLMEPLKRLSFLVS